MDRINILGIEFDNVSTGQAVQKAMESINECDKIYVTTPNSEIAYMCKENSELRNIINNAGLVLADGIGVVYASKILNRPLKQKVAGIEFCEELVNEMSKEGRSLFILGGKSGVAHKALKNLSQKYSGLKIAGYCDGYYKTEKDVIDQINNSNADVLFVCLGAPKQEIFMHENFDKLNIKVMCGAGGSVDVFAGEVLRAPDIFIKLGLEWFYRLLKQPSRIKRMMSLPLFMVEVIKLRFKK